MSAFVGIDLSTKALDLVRLDEDTNAATWVRCEMRGDDAWARTLELREALIRPHGIEYTERQWWDDVALVAIEAPYGRGRAGTNAVLNRVVGAIAASLPVHLRDPDRCWVVRPDEYRTGLGLSPRLKPTPSDCIALLGGIPDRFRGHEFLDDQNARDAYCLAYWARNELQRAIASNPDGPRPDHDGLRLDGLRLDGLRPGHDEPPPPPSKGEPSCASQSQPSPSHSAAPGQSPPPAQPDTPPESPTAGTPPHGGSNRPRASAHTRDGGPLRPATATTAPTSSSTPHGVPSAGPATPIKPVRASKPTVPGCSGTPMAGAGPANGGPLGYAG